MMGGYELAVPPEDAGRSTTRSVTALLAKPNPLMSTPNAGDGQVGGADIGARPMTRAEHTAGAPRQAPAAHLSGEWSELVRRVDLASERFERPDIEPELDHLLWGQT